MSASTADEERKPTGPRARMLPQLRHAHILSALAAQGAVQVSVIAQELGVSDMTVRRDLMDLETAGRLTRSTLVRVARRRSTATSRILKPE